MGWLKMVACLICILFSISAYAQRQQSSAEAHASVTVVAVVATEQSQPMEMNEITVSTDTSGTITISPNGTVTGAGGVTITFNNDSPFAITVGGNNDYAYSASLPDSAVIPINGGQIMITNFTTEVNTGSLSSGMGQVKLGATINIPKAEEEGTTEFEADVEIGINFN